MFWRGWSIARRLFVANLLVTLLLTAGFAAAMVFDAGSRTYEQTRQRMLSVATTMADSPLVVAGASAGDPPAALQPYALSVMGNAGVDFVTMMNPDGKRWTHPDPAQIGGQYTGSTSQAREGHPYVETTAGTLGPSVRAIVPIKDAAGNVLGMVSTGVTVKNVEVLVAARVPEVLGLAAALMLAGAVASWLVGRYLKRVTLGWGPEELGQLFAYYESVLHSVREGLVLVDTRGSMVLYNDHAALLLGIPSRDAASPEQFAVGDPGVSDPAAASPAAVALESSTPGPRRKRAGGRRASPASPASAFPDAVSPASPSPSAVTGTASPAVAPRLDALGLPDSLRELLQSGRTATDEVHLAADRLLVVSQRPALAPGSNTPAGTVATFRDHTELTALAGRLSSTQTLVEALRSQTHEHANRLHAIISLIELDRAHEALDFATADFSANVRLGGEFAGTLDEPFLAALLMGKHAQADEHGVVLELTASGTLPQGILDARELVTLLGNLVDNAIDAAGGAGSDGSTGGAGGAGTPSAATPTVWVDLLVAEDTLTITVADNGPGLPTTDLDVLGRIGTTGKTSVAPGGRGYGIALIRRAAATLGGTVTGENDGGAVMTAVVPLRQATGAGHADN